MEGMKIFVRTISSPLLVAMLVVMGAVAAALWRMAIALVRIADTYEDQVYGSDIEVTPEPKPRYEHDKEI